MDNDVYTLDCGGLPVRYSFLFPGTAGLFGDYLSAGPDDAQGPVIRLAPGWLEEDRWLVDEGEGSMPFREFQSLMLATGNALLAHGRALFHGAALLWRGRAFILTAPSGTGKTTQLRHWKRLLRKEVRVINGDKPVLECRPDGSVWACSSPWQGKEKLGTRGLGAPLGGILLLEQGDHNGIRRMEAGEAVVPLFLEFISWPEDTGQIRGQAGVLQRVLDAVPVWKLVNLGDEASAALALRELGRCCTEEGPHG